MAICDIYLDIYSRYLCLEAIGIPLAGEHEGKEHAADQPVLLPLCFISLGSEKLSYSRYAINLTTFQGGKLSLYIIYILIV